LGRGGHCLVLRCFSFHFRIFEGLMRRGWTCEVCPQMNGGVRK
jgi:hypothetical protein